MRLLLGVTWTSAFNLMACRFDEVQPCCNRQVDAAGARSQPRYWRIRFAIPPSSMRMYLFRRAVVLLFVLLAGSAQAEVNRFLDAGIPAASRPWSGADYERTFKVLSSGSVPLPQWADRPGRAVLMRMTSPDNFHCIATGHFHFRCAWKTI